jgi:aminotransferase EvaB
MRAINDLSRQCESFRDQLLGAITRVLDSSHFILGEEVRRFEEEFASYCGRPHCISVANGTDALEIALRTCDLGAGSVVATAANAGLYATCAIRAVGAIPAYVDIDPKTGLICLDALSRTCHRFKPGAIVVTHLYGRMVDMPAVCRVADSHDSWVIEDCAQAHGARIDGTCAGSWGDLGCYSFYPTKNLGAIGDAGAITAHDDCLAETSRQLRQYGWSQKYMATLPLGRNSRMDELQAAVLRTYLPHLDSWNDRRRHIASEYGQLITNPHVTPLAGSGPAYVAHLYVVRCTSRDSLRDHLRRNGIACDVHYPIPDHMQAGNQGDWLSLGLPQTEQIASELLTLPCFPELSDGEVRRIAQEVNQWRTQS